MTVLPASLPSYLSTAHSSQYICRPLTSLIIAGSSMSWLFLLKPSQWIQPRTWLFSWKRIQGLVQFRCCLRDISHHDLSFCRPKEYNGQRSVRIYTQTLSSGDPHPLAQNSLLTFDVPPYTEVRSKTNNIWFSRIKLAADIVVMQYNIGHEWMYFRFWNWMTGHDWMVRTLDQTCRRPSTSMKFRLKDTPDVLLIVHSSPLGQSC